MQNTEPVKPVFTMPLTERIIAAIIDIIIVAILCLFPRIGWLLGIIYHLTRDSLPFLKGQSFGKRLLHLKVITLPKQESLVNYPEKSIIRGLVMLIPGLNIIDFWFLYHKGQRLADIWAQTTVIYSSEADE
ncbi:hypothetical protein ACT3CD_02890 [Geofilum sp. OHC36d9]|uniref:hypothetical protein n=1 Tax=Geofilum sp. OHC36d9 TaxID=3458413 RepID=UPI004034E953